MIDRPCFFLLAAAAFALPGAASAQCFSGRATPPGLPNLVSRSVQATGDMQFVSSIIARPTLDSIARDRYSQVRPEPDSCQSHRQPVRYARRRVTGSTEQSRSITPPPITSPEQLASAKLQGAHLLWKAGQPEAARRWLQTVMADYPRTAAAVKAKDVLARM